jgi:FMN phosphatase YigB (HAD superfamily)
MQYTGVLLDLFGTLVPPYQTPEHRVIMRRCAAILGLSFEDCYRLSGESFRGRMRGLFPTMADNFAWMVRRAGGMAGPAAIRQAEKAYAQFTRDSLVPVPEAQEGLDWLRSRGLRLGLVSNCAPDVPALWKTLPIAESFEFCAFSCVVGSAKPEPEIYRPLWRRSRFGRKKRCTSGMMASRSYPARRAAASIPCRSRPIDRMRPTPKHTTVLPGTVRSFARWQNCRR